MKILTQIRDFFTSQAKIISRRPFWLFGSLFVADLIVAFILLWVGILSPANQNLEGAKPLLVLNKASLDVFIKSWDAQEEVFQTPVSQPYPDIFKGFSAEKPIQTSTSSNATSSQSH
ncbi:MAG: hypothetical protein PHE77_02610 [Candidatus Pacebacteria bacterium]|nr:hypothetical protein [Candidatus Paceibacterota bacterium]